MTLTAVPVIFVVSTPSTEEAAIQARIQTCREDAPAQEVHDEVGKVLGALRTAGWKPLPRIKDIKLTRAGPLPGRDPAQSADT